MAITEVVPTLDNIPSTADPANFDSRGDNFLGVQLPAFGASLNLFGQQANALAEAMNAVAAGGAVSLQYTFSSTTTDADPGAGMLRLNNATQNAATVIRADLLGRDTSDYSGLLALLDDSTSATKGYITLRHVEIPTKWIVFALTAVASPAGYKNITVTPAASSSANPFANGDEILFDFTPNGDRGRPSGWLYAYSSTTTAADPGAGWLRFNNATLASATALYISETDGDGLNLAAVIAGWDDSTSTIKAQLKVYKQSNPSIFAFFNITGSIVDNGTWRTVTIAHVASNGALVSSDSVMIEVEITGLKGDTGSISGGNLTGPLYDARTTIASAASANIWTGGNAINWTGTTTATGFAAAPQAGARVRLHCAAAAAFTAGANMLIAGVTSGNTVTCAVNDIVEVEALTTTLFRLTRLKYDGTAQVAYSGVGNHQVVVHTGNGHGSTNTKIRRYTTTLTNVGTAITYADSVANGASFTINEDGLYEIYRHDASNSGYATFGASLNSSQLTTAITSVTTANVLMIGSSDSTSTFPGAVTRTVRLSSGDVIRPHSGVEVPNATTANFSMFSIIKVGE